jgi:hypothetical protein
VRTFVGQTLEVRSGLWEREGEGVTAEALSKLPRVPEPLRRQEKPSGNLLEIRTGTAPGQAPDLCRNGATA